MSPKITEYQEDVTPTFDDLILTVDNPASSPQIPFLEMLLPIERFHGGLIFHFKAMANLAA